MRRAAVLTARLFARAVDEVAERLVEGEAVVAALGPDPSARELRVDEVLQGL